MADKGIAPTIACNKREDIAAGYRAQRRTREVAAMAITGTMRRGAASAAA